MPKKFTSKVFFIILCLNVAFLIFFVYFNFGLINSERTFFKKDIKTTKIEDKSIFFVRDGTGNSFKKLNNNGIEIYTNKDNNIVYYFYNQGWLNLKECFSGEIIDYINLFYGSDKNINYIEFNLYEDDIRQENLIIFNDSNGNKIHEIVLPERNVFNNSF